jgi:ribonuclease PH
LTQFFLWLNTKNASHTRIWALYASTNGGQEAGEVMEQCYERLLGRAWDSLREIKITPHYIHSGASSGSCLVEFGQTRVICTASVEERVPPFLENTGLGWLTAEYGMLPASTHTRMSRDRTAHSGRTYEIQRLIGRSLRASLDRSKLGSRQITIDCDVLEADGGTRTASITGGFVALTLTIRKLLSLGTLRVNPIIREVAAVSLGKVRGAALLDLNFVEDSTAEVDANLVATYDGDIIEWQATSERGAMPLASMTTFLELGMKGIRKLIEIQRSVLANA